MESLIGQTIDNYRIDEIIGRGGMGVVFKATDMSLEKTVAVKMIDPFLARDENFLKRFKTEAKALAKLQNQNIVSVYALRETGIGVFMVMEYVKARTVSEWIREKGKLTIAETITVTRQLLNAIGHAHSVGVIHRDIKPNNILFCENGNVKVMDFGLAKVVQDTASQNTATQTAAGTLYYMSPEQIKGLKNVDNRSDIYSVGMTIYEMAAGRTPFDKDKSDYDIQKQIIDGDIPSPLTFNPGIPKTLVKVIKKSIDKDPAKRYQSIDELKAALNEVDIPAENLADRTVVMNTKTTASEKISRPGKLVQIGIPAAAIVILVMIYLIFLSGPPEKEDEAVDNTGKKDIKTVTDTEAAAEFSIMSSPEGADVFINGKKSGTTPYRAAGLTAGRYSIMLKKSGYEDYIKEYDLQSGFKDLNIPLKIISVVNEGTLVLGSEPPSEIFIGDKTVNQPSVTLKAGTYNIKFIHPRYGTKSSSVKIAAGQKKILTCYFEQTINIQSLNKSGDAFWGTVYINGTNTNMTTPVNIPVGPGKYTISVKKAGYKTVEDDVTVYVNPEFSKKTNSLVFHFQ